MGLQGVKAHPGLRARLHGADPSGSFALAGVFHKLTNAPLCMCIDAGVAFAYE